MTKNIEINDFEYTDNSPIKIKYVSIQGDQHRVFCFPLEIVFLNALIAIPYIFNSVAFLCQQHRSQYGEFDQFQGSYKT